MISVSKGGDPVTDPSQVESKKWGGSIFDDDAGENKDYFNYE